MTIWYREGGNPPINAGLFKKRESGRGQEVGERIAWWPAGYSPTTVNMQIIINEYMMSGQVVSRERCRELLHEDL